MKKTLSVIALLVFLGISGMTNSSNAATVALDVGEWEAFTIGSIGSLTSDNYVFTISETMSFYVTDGYRIGDQFEVFSYDGSSYTSLGQTSYMAPSTAYSISDPQTAYDSGYYSTGEFILSPGSYDIFLRNLGPSWSGTAFVKLDSSSPVPVPSTISLLTVGLLGFAGLSRKKK